MERRKASEAAKRRTKNTSPYNYEADLRTISDLSEKGLRAIIGHYGTIIPATSFSPKHVDILRRELTSFVEDSISDSYDENCNPSTYLLSQALKERALAIKTDLVDKNQPYHIRCLSAGRVALELYALADAVASTISTVKRR